VRHGITVPLLRRWRGERHHVGGRAAVVLVLLLQGLESDIKYSSNKSHVSSLRAIIKRLQNKLLLGNCLSMVPYANMRDKLS
jgi:hypothetical protein